MIIRLKPYYCQECEAFLRNNQVRSRKRWIAKCKFCGRYVLHTTTYLEGVIWREGQHRKELLRKLKGEDR